MADMVRVFAPGSIGNVGPGLDILGLAVDGAGDTVTLTWSEDDHTVVTDPGGEGIPADPKRNTAAIAAVAVLRRVGVERGLQISISKGLPISGGQGGSAASAVAGAVAASLLSGAELDTVALLECALEGESTVAGTHLDNLAPSLMGGLVLCRSTEPIDVVRIPVPQSLRVVLVHPDQQMRTRDARAALPESVRRDVAIAQAANVAAMVAAAFSGDLELLTRALDDRIAEPARAPLLPGFTAARRAALEAGALGSSISGSGPTAFAFAHGEEHGSEIAAAMLAAYRTEGITARARVAAIDLSGARAE